MFPNRILVGYDGSSEADRALDLAADLARASHGTLIIEHVVSIGAEAYAAGVLDLDALEAALGKMLDGAVERANRAGVTATKGLSRGDVAATLLPGAERERAGLMGAG